MCQKRKYEGKRRRERQIWSENRLEENKGIKIENACTERQYKIKETTRAVLS
jgi:hypothetical protein